MGPVDLIEVNESEYIRTEDVHDILEYDSAPRTWKQVIVEDIIVPIARGAIEQLLDIGFQRLDVWMEEKSVPAAKQKAKKAGKDISIFFSAMKSAIKGEQPKALQIIEAEKKKNNNSVQVVDTVDSKQNEKESREKVEITQAEFEQLVALTKKKCCYACWLH